MKNLSVNINVSDKLYTKNPDNTTLGNNIVSASIDLINELGFEDFTFKKLSIRINSPESSIYRYFDSKHALLVYLTSWYWSWTEYRIVMSTINVEVAQERLKKSIEVLVKPVIEDLSVSYVNEVKLSKIIITESIKAYHTKDVDLENEKGCFSTYKNVVGRVANFVLEVNPNYPYAHMLISTIVEGAHQQRYFAEHLPALTDTNSDRDNIVDFYKEMISKLLT